MGVVFTDDITGNSGRFLVGFVPVIAEFIHRVEDATMDRFQAVPHVGEGPADDDTHGIVHIGLLHLLFDFYGDVLAGDLHGIS
jgi:hypothetical protein